MLPDCCDLASTNSLAYREGKLERKTAKEVIGSWVLSSVGRAAPLQGVGHRFEPCSTHHDFQALCPPRRIPLFTQSLLTD